jgi:hypothetical protein
VAALALPEDPCEPTVPVLPPSIDRQRRDYWLPLAAADLRLPTALWSHLAPAGQCTLWWHHGESPGHGPALYVGSGLPDAGIFLEFLGGQALAQRVRAGVA